MHKKQLLNISILFCLLVGCQKIDNNMEYSESHNAMSLRSGISPANKFDTITDTILIAVGQFGSQIHNDSLPAFDLYYEEFTVSYNQSFDYDENYMLTLNSEEYNLFFQCIEFVLNSELPIIEALISIEDSIINDESLSENVKDKILYNLSVMRMTLQGFFNIYPFPEWPQMAPTWEDLHEDCIRNQMNEIWSHPVDSIAFVTGLPVSWNWDVAHCAYNATVVMYYS